MIFHLDTDNYKDIRLSFSEKELNSEEFSNTIMEFCYALSSFYVNFCLKNELDTERAESLKPIVVKTVEKYIDQMLKKGILEPDDMDELEDELDELEEKLRENGFSDSEIDNIIELVRESGGTSEALQDLLSGFGVSEDDEE